MPVLEWALDVLPCMSAYVRSVNGIVFPNPDTNLLDFVKEAVSI